MSAQSGPRCRYCGQPDNGSALTIVCERCKTHYRPGAINQIKALVEEQNKLMQEFNITADEVAEVTK